MTTSLNLTDLHLTQSCIFQAFLDDPRTMNLRMKHNASLHQAVLVKRGKIIAEATNNYGTRSRGSGYSKGSIHAEKNVVKELGDISKMKGADMYVMRFTRSDPLQFVKSIPCPSCTIFLEKCMREYGLKNVYYTS